ncbi:MAG: transglutaminase domain-containing protein [Ruminiclostridium sp.]|nr:transglutaminase domain-containing protein [Ruminiclostridium sp.]
MRKSPLMRILSLCAAILLCSSCTANQVSSSVHTFTSDNPPVTAVSTTTEVTDSSSEPSQTTTSAVVTTEEKTTTTVSTTSEEETTTVSEEITSVQETTISSEETTETTTSVSVTTTTTTTTTSQTAESVAETSQTQLISETSVPAAQKPPAEIKVSKVSSPGTKKEDTGTASVDYSNASDGYISASYSGSSKKAKLRIVCNGVTCDHDLPVTGEKTYFPLMQGSGDYRIQIYEQYDGKMYMSVLDISVNVKIADEIGMYLYSNSYSKFDEKSDCVIKSAELCGGAKDDIEKIAAIFTYITDNVTYDYNLAATVQSGYIPDPDKVLKVKKGICFDYASLFAAMCRSQGIPTRLVIGYAADDIYHAWNEVYTKETGWITPELLLKNKGYNIVDATFYASAENKKSIADYISDSGNYSSVYRY